MPEIDRRSFVAAGLSSVVLLTGCTHKISDPRTGFENDFDQLWHLLRDQYCFFGEKQTDWDRVAFLYRPMAQQAASFVGFNEVIRLVLAELYDPHTRLSRPTVGSPRVPPFDLLVHRHSDALEVSAIDEGSAAHLTGLSIGDKIVGIDDVSVSESLAALRPRCLSQPDPEAETYVANSAVAGRFGLARKFLVKRSDHQQTMVDLPLHTRIGRPDVEWTWLDGNVGYIAIRSFSNRNTVTHFDRALLELREAAGLIIDVRQNGGGDTAVARPIMGRFVKEQKPYALMRRREGATLGPSWVEYVNPRGPFTYERPVVVLCNHWSASMAEGFPMGMRGIGRATIVGTKMMGLGAAVFSTRLRRTGIKLQYSAEPVYDVHDRPRWNIEPDIAVSADVDILKAGLSELASLIAPS